jgi:recombination protein RecR
MKKGLERLHNLIESLEMLPTIGKKSARNIALYMVKEDNFAALKIAHAIEEAVSTIKNCTRCGGLSEHELCEICSDEGRDHAMVCLVNSTKDIFTIEDSGHYHGLYFVFESIERSDIEKLLSMMNRGVEEIIFAFPPSLQNDALIYFIEEKLGSENYRFSKIAQGVPTGVNLENVDALSLSRAIESRVRI